MDTDDSSAWVSGWDGVAYTAVPVPSATALPSYLTSPRAEMCLTTGALVGLAVDQVGQQAHPSA